MSTPIRAVLLTGPLEVTATNLRTLDLARALLCRGIHVTVVAGPGELEQRYRDDDVPVVMVELAGRYLEDLPRLPALKRAVATLEPHLIHIIDQTLFRHGSAVSRASGTPLLLSLDSTPGKAVAARYGLLRGILVPARSIRDELVLRGRAPAEAVRVMPPGIDLSRFPVPAVPFAGGRPILTTVAPLPKAPGMEPLLRAVKILRKRELGVHLVIAGHGPGDLGLRGRIRDEGLSRDITVTGLPLDLERVFAATDIYLRAARPGGFGRALLMAMASGRPVVAEGNGPALSLVREGETGFLVPTGDPELLAARIAGLIEAPDRAVACGAAGRRAAEKMGMAGPATILETLYRDIVSST